MTGAPWWWHRLKPRTIWLQTRLMDTVPGLRVTSGWRSVAQNLRAKGHPFSGHLRGLCVDVVGSSEAMRTARAEALRLGAYRALIHDAGSGTHLHLDWR